MSKHILVMDPSRVMRTLFAIYGQQASYQPIVVSNPAEARLALRTVQHIPEMLFLALHPGEKEERALLREVQMHPQSARTRLVLMLAPETLARERHFLEEIPAHHLMKPFRIQDVLALLVPLTV